MTKRAKFAHTKIGQIGGIFHSKMVPSLIVLKHLKNRITKRLSYISSNTRSALHQPVAMIATGRCRDASMGRDELHAAHTSIDDDVHAKVMVAPGRAAASPRHGGHKRWNRNGHAGAALLPRWSSSPYDRCFNPLHSRTDHRVRGLRYPISPGVRPRHVMVWRRWG